MRFLSGLLLLITISQTVRADFIADLQASSAPLEQAMPKSGLLLRDGKFAEANAVFLNTFPAATRTPAQSMAIANVLFLTDPTDSYRLHQQVAGLLPNEPDVQYEWAIEQHRAKDYAGAAASYAKYIAAHPDYAPAMGLRAECLMRTGKIREAVDCWQNSLRAHQGTLEDFETLVCQVNGAARPEKERCDLLEKVAKGDAAAAAKLIDLDCSFRTDWWNSDPNRPYLEHDLALLRHAKVADQRQCDEALCVGDYTMLDDPQNPPDASALQKLLQDRGYLLDAHHTLPTNSRLMLVMMAHAMQSNAIDPTDATKWFGEAVEARANKEKQPEHFLIAAILQDSPATRSQILQQGWQVTGDVCLAQPILLDRERAGQLQANDAMLAECARKFPEDAIIAGLVYRHTPTGGKAEVDALVRAIEAEYTHFSPDSHQADVDLPRPGAQLLSSYFKKLSSLKHAP